MVKTWTNREEWLHRSNTEGRIRFGSDGNGVFVALNTAGITGNRAQSWVLFDSVEFVRIMPGEFQAWVRQGLFLEADLIAAARWLLLSRVDVDKLWLPIQACSCSAGGARPLQLATLTMCRECGGGIAK